MAAATSGLEHNTKLNIFYDCDDFRIFSAPSFWPYCQPWEWAKFLEPTDYVCFLDWNLIWSKDRQVQLAEAFGDRAIFLSSSEFAHNMRTELGLRSFLVSNNAFVNENIFICTNKTFNDREFRAVYTARAAAVKRIHLAAKTPKLALVVNRSFVSGVISLDESYLQVPNIYLNSGHLTAAELTSLYNRTKCGLILSSAEGACFTVVEYLLSGIPVVSTRPEAPRGLGGREVWFTPYNSAYCDPVPESVADAVSEVISRNLNPETIRAECIAEMKKQRRVLRDQVLKPIFDRHASKEDLDDLVFGPDAWFKSSSSRHRFSAEHVNLSLSNAITLLRRES